MGDSARRIEPLLAAHELDRLRTALAPFTADAVQHVLGPVGRAAHQRGDLTGVARCVDSADTADTADTADAADAADTADTADTSPERTFVRLFLLGAAVPLADARAAFDPLPLDAAAAAGVLAVTGDEVRARLEIRPYAEVDCADDWWVVSDLGSDVRPGPLATDHVLGIGNAALTLAQATPRGPVGRALDLGTGCGVQALHLGRHAGQVTATDISDRALRFAATTAALSGQAWQLRQGSFTEPVAGELFDLVVANPPFVVSPGGPDGRAEFDYRDSGQAGDRVCRDLVRSIPAVLAAGGTAQLLANWIIPAEGAWQERVAGWFTGGCDAWVWQREVADLGEYVTMWLRDAGFVPGTDEWTRRYDTWLDWFAANDAAAVGMGMITMRRRSDDDGDATVVLEDVPQAVAQPIGDEVATWFDRHRHLSRATTAELLTARYRVAPDLVCSRDDLLETDGGWQTRRAVLRQVHGMRWEVEVDDAVARIVAACDAGAIPLIALDVLALTSGDDSTRLSDAFAPVLRDLVRRGFLLPEGAR